MQYYLVRLSYTADAWREIIDKAQGLQDRLSSVTSLVGKLGGSFANYHFFEKPFFDDPKKQEVVICKFVPFGEHDVVAILAMPDNVTARSFSMIVSAEPGVKTIEMTPMISLEESTNVMASARSAAADYAAPGRPKP